MARTIYLDNAATTRVAPEVAEVIASCMGEDYGNPASAHGLGIAAERRVKRARQQLLAAIADPDGDLGNIIWTSGGTEGDALGVIGAARTQRGRGRHILYSAIEHPAIRESAELLVADGWRTEVIPVTRQGVIEPATAVEMLSADTSVVALMLVNNELGTLLPVAETARAIHAAAPQVHVHCDAVQALGKVAIDVGALGVDSIAFAAHKLHGPKGVGALWLGKSRRLMPLWAGGGQQDGLRSGTLNVPGIAGMGAAVSLAVADLATNQERWAEMARTLLSAANDCGIEVTQHCAAAPRAAHVISLGFRGLPTEPLLHALEGEGVMVSAGSACAERSHHLSPVLTAIGVDDSWATLRFSFARDTSLEDVATAAAALRRAVRAL